MVTVPSKARASPQVSRKRVSGTCHWHTCCQFLNCLIRLGEEWRSGQQQNGEQSKKLRFHVARLVGFKNWAKLTFPLPRFSTNISCRSTERKRLSLLFLRTQRFDFSFFRNSTGTCR